MEDQAERGMKEEDVDEDVRRLVEVIVRTLRFVVRWLERRYGLKS